MKRTICLFLAVLLVVCTLQPVLSVSAEGKPDRNGYDSGEKKTYDVAGIRYSIPDCYELQTTDLKDYDLFVAFEDGREVCGIFIRKSLYTTVSAETFREQKYAMCRNYMQQSFVYTDYRFESIAHTNQNIGVVRGEPGSAPDRTMYAGLIRTNAGLAAAYLMEFDDASYDYSQDYLKILDHAQPVPAAGSTSASGVTPSVREALDSYEAFVDEYVAFMEDYARNPYDMNMLLRLSTMMTRYADLMQALSDMENDSNMTAADTAYFLEVYGRIMQKLAGAITLF